MEHQSPLTSVVDRLREVYYLSDHAIKPLMTLKHLDITSIAYTIDGGFDSTSGTYHSETRAFNYKIRVQYYDEKSSPKEKTVVLLGVEEGQAVRYRKRNSASQLKMSPVD